MHESIILLLPTPTCIARTNAMLFHVYCAIYDAPPTPHVHAMHKSILVMARSCKGQVLPNRPSAWTGRCNGCSSSLSPFLPQTRPISSVNALICSFVSVADDDKFTPTKHLTPPPHHSSRPAAAHTDTETPLQKKKGRARRRTARTDVAHKGRRTRVIFIPFPTSLWGAAATSA